MAEVPLIFDPDEMVRWFLNHAPDPTIEQIEEAGGRLGRTNYPGLVLSLHIELGLGSAVLAHCVTSAWVDCEFPNRTLDDDDWEWLFADAGFTIDGARAQLPTDPIRMFRGAIPEHQRGWSWTENRELAQWFAARPHNEGRGLLYTALAPPGALFAGITRSWTHGRTDEEQWVVDTRRLDITAEPLSAEPKEETTPR